MLPDDTRSLWLRYLLSGASFLRIPALLNQFHSIRAAVESGVDGLVASGIKSEAAHRLIATDALPWERELEEAEKNGISIVPFDDPSYPEVLRHISAPPPVLFVRGTLPGNGQPCIAVVGTRHPSLYGIRMTARFAGDFVRFGFIVVSGLARGIDTRAHQAALASGGQTTAVIGSGLLNLYPAENEELARRIVATGGAVISEFPLQTAPRPENFPRRNRIISGLCSGVVVIEAGRRSGALITADYALEQGKDVFAVPGPADSIRSAGTHFLIKQGARLVEQPEEIVEELGWRLFPSASPIAHTANTQESLSEEERAVLAALDGPPRQIEDLLDMTHLPASSLNRILSLLETRGIIRGLPGRFYCRMS